MKELLDDPRITAAIDAVEDTSRQDAEQFARKMEAVHDAVALTDRLVGRDGVERHLVIDLAGTLRIGQQSATSLMLQAGRLVEVHTTTLAGLKDGRVLQHQARSILTETVNCSEQVQAAVDARLHAHHPDGLQHLHGSRLTRLLRTLVLQIETELEPDTAAQRQQTARDNRHVHVRPEPDGMASLWALLPAEQLRAFTLTFDELLRRQIIADRQHGTIRTADQRRADVFALLPALALHALSGTAPHHPDGSLVAHAQIVLTIHLPLATALGLSEHPATLDGYGPISATHARTLIPTSTLRRVIVDDTTGRPLYTGTHLTLPPPTTTPTTNGTASSAPVHPHPGNDADTPQQGDSGASETADCGHASAAECDADDAVRARILELLHTQPIRPEDLLDLPEPHHDPSATLTAFLRIRDPQCTGPGCSVHARASDLDHRTPWPQGPTTAANINPKSRRCHHAKTFTWTVTTQTDGTHHWHSPTGRTYTVPPYWTPPPTPRTRPRRPEHHPSTPYTRWPQDLDPAGVTTPQPDRQHTPAQQQPDRQQYNQQQYDSDPGLTAALRPRTAPPDPEPTPPHPDNDWPDPPPF